MDSMYYAKIAHPSIGFTQQIFNLVNSIILAMKNGKKMVVVDEFLKNPEKEEYVPISIFIDLDKLNSFLSKKYAVKVFDKHLTQVSIKSITYGIKHREKNISAEMLEHFCKDDNTIRITTDVDLNRVFGDPMIGVPKSINIYYCIKHNYTEHYSHINEPEYAGFLKTEFYQNFSITNQNYILNEQSFGELDKYKFDDILHNISFTDFFKENSERFLQEIHMIDSKIKKLNVIHLRLEDDAITKYSKSTDDTIKESFKSKLVQKYIENIEQHIDKNDETVLLTYSLENPVIEFLKSNGYHYHIKTKELEAGREMNAIIDVCIGINCNNVFIGNFNNDTTSGSKFSYFLSKQMPYNVKPFYIDICNL
jgi:hypothetical protein